MNVMMKGIVKSWLVYSIIISIIKIVLYITSVVAKEVTNK